MGAYAKDGKLLIHFFQESLTGAVVTRYTNLEGPNGCNYRAYARGGTDLSKNTPKGGGIWQHKWFPQ